MTDREFVLANWEWVQVRLAEPFEGIAQGKWTARLPLLPFSQYPFDTEAEAWAAAAEFTRERLEQIRQLEEEIREGEFVSLRFLKDRGDCWKRILARLESALANLKRGMR